MKKLLLFLIVVYSCQDTNHTGAICESQEQEIEHFPIDMGSRSEDLIIVDSSGFYNTTKMVLQRKIALNELNTIISKKYYLTCKAKDSCIVVINDFLGPKNKYVKLDKQKSSITSKCKKMIPVPNFYDLKKINYETKSYLNPNCEIFITKLNVGYVSTKIDPKKSSMPKPYFHGSVSGIVLNREDTSAIYFVQFW